MDFLYKYMYIVVFAVSQVGVLDIVDVHSLGTTCRDANVAINTALTMKKHIYGPSGSGITVCGLKHGKFIKRLYSYAKPGTSCDRTTEITTHYSYGKIIQTGTLTREGKWVAKKYNICVDGFNIIRYDTNTSNRADNFISLHTNDPKLPPGFTVFVENPNIMVDFNGHMYYMDNNDSYDIHITKRANKYRRFYDLMMKYM